MSSLVGVASQEVYFCASDNTCSTSFASNFLTIGPAALASLVVNVRHSAILGGLSGLIFSSLIRDRWLVTRASIQEIVLEFQNREKGNKHSSFLDCNDCVPENRDLLAALCQAPSRTLVSETSFLFSC